MNDLGLLQTRGSRFIWSTLSDYGAAPSPRYGSSMCKFGNKLFVFGGYGDHGEFRYGDLCVFDLKERRWLENENGLKVHGINLWPDLSMICVGEDRILVSAGLKGHCQFSWIKAT